MKIADTIPDMPNRFCCPRLIRYTLFTALTLYIVSSVYAGEPKYAAMATDGSSSLYSYSEDDIPEVFFFPKEKARWDGSKVTMKEWYLLSDLQKEKFISEYTAMLKSNYGKSVEVVGFDYLRALNIFSYYSNDKCLNEPSTDFIDRILCGQGKIKKDN